MMDGDQCATAGDDDGSDGGELIVISLKRRCRAMTRSVRAGRAMYDASSNLTGPVRCLPSAADHTDDDAEEQRRSLLDDSFTQEQFQFSLDTMAPPQNSVCAVCFEPLPGLVSIRCWDCRMEGELLCPEHDASRHARAHLHRRDHFVDGYAAPLAPCDVLRIKEGEPPRIESKWAHLHVELHAAASGPCRTPSCCPRGNTHHARPSDA